MRDKIWKMVQDLMEEENHQELCMYEGVKKYEAEVQDIIDNIEELAAKIEQKIAKDREDKENQEPDAHCPIRGHNMV